MISTCALRLKTNLHSLAWLTRKNSLSLSDNTRRFFYCNNHSWFFIRKKKNCYVQLFIKILPFTLNVDWPRLVTVIPNSSTLLLVYFLRYLLLLKCPSYFLGSFCQQPVMATSGTVNVSSASLNISSTASIFLSHYVTFLSSVWGRWRTPPTEPSPQPIYYLYIICKYLCF